MRSILLLSCLLTACTQHHERHITIFPIGTSITVGGNYAPGSWRAALSTLLHDNDYSVDFGGDQRAATDPPDDGAGVPFDGRSEAYDAAFTGGLDEHVVNYMSANPRTTFTYALIEAGISDFHVGASPAQVAAGVTKIVQDCRAFNPHVVILLSEVFHVTTPEDESITQLNVMLPAICDAAQPCRVVHDASLLTDSDKVGLYHPSAEGSVKLARAFFAEIDAR